MDEVAQRLARVEKTRLYEPLKSATPDKWPIVYHSMYNISFYGLERCHPFDAGKWGRIFKRLTQKGGLLPAKSTFEPLQATKDDLLVVHTKRYLCSLTWSAVVATVMEVPCVACLPNCLVDRKALKPFRFHAGGTILAAQLAMDYGWAINLGGGFHHCSADQGGGFCAYADITLALQFQFLQGMNGISRAMIIDLDAHQGNGHERDFTDDDRVYILDMYNGGIYPNDTKAKKGIRKRVELRFGIESTEYLRLLAQSLTEALEEFGRPDLILYNAGTDCLIGDPLGALDVTPDGIIQRDQFVFETARSNPDPIPIVMVTSGGYQQNNADVIADSILNLHNRGLIGPCGKVVPSEMSL